MPDPAASVGLCPRCLHAVPTRTAPSGTTRLVRHAWQDRSCTGTGWPMNPAPHPRSEEPA